MPTIGMNTGLYLAKQGLGFRPNIYMGYRFLIDMGGTLAGAFMEVTSLSARTEVETIESGGENGFEYQLPRGTKYSDITLLKGITNVDLLYNWYREVCQGTIHRKNLSIYLLNDAGIPVMWWDVMSAYPRAWEGPKLNSMASAIATESIVLAHHGIEQPIASQLLSGAQGAMSLAAGIL